VLNLFATARSLGVVLSYRTAVRLGIPGEVYEPDLCFVRRERLGIVTPSYIGTPPDLAVEILSRVTDHYILSSRRRSTSEPA
jgi:Uma2 family endonuclease